MFRTIRISCAVMLCMISVKTDAGEASVKQAFQKRFPGEVVQAVTLTPYLGLYEVIVSDKIFYTDENVSYVFVGNVVDTETMENLTEERIRYVQTKRFDSLPLDLAIRKVKGDGLRKIAVFSDPDCPYCKKLERELVSVSNVAIYTFLLPIDILHPTAKQKAKAVWCSKDKAKAWDSLMLDGIVPVPVNDCSDPISEISKLGKKLRIRGTPTLIFPDGRVVSGAVTKAELEKLLEASGQR